MNIFDKELFTKRTQLRRIDYDDLTDMFEYTSNPAVTRYLEWDPHSNIAQTREFIKKTINDYNTSEYSFTWGIEYIDNAKFIGVLRIYDYVPGYGKAEISYIINPDFQGRGIMSEAILKIFSYCFVELKLVRIQAKCSTSNSGSVKLLERIGMTREGCLRKFLKLGNIYHDSYIYAITSDDYFKKN